MKSEPAEKFVMTDKVVQVIDREGDLWRRHKGEVEFTLVASDVKMSAERLEKRFGPLIECDGL